MEIVLTKNNLPALWEKGGGRTNSGTAQVIAGHWGERLPPIFYREGKLCGEHALFIVHPGSVIVYARHHNQDMKIRVSRVKTISLTTQTLECDVLYVYEAGQWDIEPPGCFLLAIEAAKEKAGCYHCDAAHYLQKERVTKRASQYLEIIR